MTISLPIDPDANDLLSRSPLALLIGMLLDQQIPIERAFTAPRDLARRLGHEPTAAELAGLDAGTLTAVFGEKPALHRYPRAMAGRVQQLCRLIVDRYDGDAANLWAGATSGSELPGFGADKARILLALLGKQFGVRPQGWRDAAGHFGTEGAHHSVADIVDDVSLQAVRDYKQTLKGGRGHGGRGHGERGQAGRGHGERGQAGRGQSGRGQAAGRPGRGQNAS